MLVIISDLHFTDGTTSNKDEKGQDITNVNPRAFKLFTEKIAEIIKRHPVPKVTFIYNGDIFDPLRTSDWFDASDNECPWEKPYDDPKMLEKYGEIFDKIISHNAEALQWLSGCHKDFFEVWPKDIKTDRVYIPGNHDRVINMDESMRRKVYEVLLNKPGRKACFKNFILDSDHQTLVMHGHEADAYNCEFDRNGNPRYRAQPIGDAMTTMLFTIIGHKAQRLAIPSEAKKRFRDIEHVRPNFVGISYVQDIIKDFPKTRDKVARMADEIVTDFEDIDYVKDWMKKHDKWNLKLDEADKLQDALRAIKLFGTHVPSGLLEKLAGFIQSTTHAQFAEKQLKSAIGQSARFCVLGHSHEPVHVPLFIDEDKIEKHYLNSGTFRLNLGRAFDGEDFMRFQRMSFVIIYGPNELTADETAYELWSGIRTPLT